jgi:deoxyadenosine/deoxycytidine kinase
MSFITIEGNIGSGKSTLINRLRQELKDDEYEFVFIDEPVDIWQSLKDENGQSLLQLFYQDSTRWGYTLQSTAFITRYMNSINALKQQQRNTSSKSKTVFISERCVLTDRYVFAEMLKDTNKLSPIEWSVYVFWYEQFAKLVPIRGVIYVKTDPETCVERIKKRGRIGEENIPRDYINDLTKYHENWIYGTKMTSPRSLTSVHLESVEDDVLVQAVESDVDVSTILDFIKSATKQI